ncbi:MAG: NAD(P)H-dependent oxidoreductase [Marinobacter sp.]|uniref:FMN-dependent NADH-azoreductase n=1 Tax=Marinobacter sp. TaxID=50741 RepID=UPI0034A0580E
MKNILVITTSIFGQTGQSSQLVEKTISNLKAQHPTAAVIYRDLSKHPVPHIDAERFGAFTTSASDRSDLENQVIAYSDELISEIVGADAVILGVPMYNFGIPSTLKAYFDHIARSGVTFRYTDQGPEGLLEDRPVLIMAARGGIYAGTENDTQTPYLRTFLGFLGLKDVSFVYAEGLAMGDDKKDAALDKASTKIDALTA